MSTTYYPNPLWSTLPTVNISSRGQLSETLQVDHIIARESIAFLIIKLILIHIITTILLILLYIPMFWASVSDNIMNEFFSINTFVLVTIKFFEGLLSVVIIFKWLNEYFEITPNKLIYRNGLMFKKKDEYIFIHLMSVDLQQTVMGRILNYGTLHLYDRYINKDIYLYQIHNPKKFFSVLKELIPYTDTDKSEISGKLINDEEYED